jgi:hypothetical protein
MNKLSRTTLIFALAFAIFLLTPAFINSQFGPYPLTKYGDWFDLLTPLVLLPLYWLLLQGGWQATAAPRFTFLFLLLAAVWAQAQGMHLTGNAIGHLLSESDGDPYTLTYFFDEKLSHILWHIANMGLAALVFWRHWRNPLADQRPQSSLEIPAGVLHGLTFFIVIVEGQTGWLGIPFALIIALAGFIGARQWFKERPALLFWSVAFLVALLCFAIWGIYWGGLPEFSEVGIIE